MSRVIESDALYYVRAVCPACDQVTEIPVRLDARLNRTRTDAALSLKVSQEKMPHRCGQTTMTVVAETGEVLFSTGEAS